MAEKLLYSMGDVAEMFDVNTSLIRYWESQFKILRPQRNKKGNRLFSSQDVENLKLIYHLVKECGMTLDGARKALRKPSLENPVERDAELMERLQKIRSLLVEVREDLKAGGTEIVTDEESVVEEPMRKPKKKAVVKIDEATGEEIVKQAEPASAKESRPRKPRKKQGDDENKELFAFYEQSLF